jgi:cell wall-associated NlpC family hydrolase
MKFSQLLNFFFVLLILSLIGCASSARRASPARSADGRTAIERASSETAPGSERRRLLNEAGHWLGIPYRYGGSTTAGVDCSGFVCNVFRAAVEKKLPRSSSEQAKVGEEVEIDDAQPGDLVFFNTSGGGVSHVGILINTEQFIHASTSLGVIVSSLSEGYYRQRFMFVRKVLE